MKNQKRKILLSVLVLVLIMSTLSMLVACVSKPKTVDKPKENVTVEIPDTLVGAWTEIEPDKQNDETEAEFVIEKRDGKLYFKKFFEGDGIPQGYLNTHPIDYDKETGLYNCVYYQDLKVKDDNTIALIIYNYDTDGSYITEETIFYRLKK